MSILGSEYMTLILHSLAQTLLIPVLLGLLFMAVFIMLELGAFIAERRARKETSEKRLIEALYDVEKNQPWQIQNLKKVVENSNLSKRQKMIVMDFIDKKSSNQKGTWVLAKDILDHEEINYQKKLSRTDLISKLGPVFGLMGTLIPLGPGLAALGQGDIRGLSQAVIIAFDTTVLGVAVGAFGLIISKARRAWYQQDLNYMESLLELVEGSDLIDQEQEKKNLFGGSRK